MSISKILRYCAEETIEEHLSDSVLEREKISEEVLEKIRIYITCENALLDKTARMSIPKDIPFACIADFMKSLDRVVLVSRIKGEIRREYCQLAIYENEGPMRGLYNTDIERIKSIIRLYKHNIDRKDMKEVLETLRGEVDIIYECTDVNLVPVNNGIFDIERKRLRSFTRELVFLRKSPINYDVKCRKSPMIHNSVDGTDWDIETWMSELSDNPEIVKLLWQIIAASIRQANYNKALLLYNTVGCNGKSTFLDIIRGIVGPGNYADVSIDKMSQRFGLCGILNAAVILSDENNISTYITSSENFKRIVTGDPMEIEEKFKHPVLIKYRGIVIQNVNSLPRFSDTTDSLYRRIIMIPFEKSFLGAGERKYIKSDYVHREEVLKYVLYKCLNMDFVDFDVPDECKRLLVGLKLENDPIRQFIDEVIMEISWDFIPQKYLYPMYKKYYSNTHPSGKVCNKRSFTMDFDLIMQGCADWEKIDFPTNTDRFDFLEDEVIDDLDLDEFIDDTWKRSGKSNSIKYIVPSKSRGYLKKKIHLMPFS